MEEQSERLPQGEVARQIAFYIADCADAAYLDGERYQDLGPTAERLALHFDLAAAEVAAQLAQLESEHYVRLEPGPDREQSPIYPTAKMLQLHPSFADITEQEAGQFIDSLRR